MSEEKGQWAIVEIMGHKIVAGYVTSETQFGDAMLRIDVPETSAYPKFTQLYGVSAIYCITYVSEEVARRTAEHNQTNPVGVYVPELVTIEKHREVVDKLKEQIERLRQAQLPARAGPNDGLDDEDGEDDFDRDD